MLGKSQMRQMWSWFLRDLDQRVTSNCTNELQTRPFIREGSQHEDRKCPRVIKICSWTPDGGLTPRQTCRWTVGLKITWTCWCPETEISSVYWALLSGSHLKTWTKSSHGNVISMKQDCGQCPEL
jgi:hypothetical protein